MRERLTRAKQVEQNDARLMDAARKVFVKRGYHGASLDQVAAAAGLTKGAVYARFASKAELMLALLEARVAEREDQMRRAVGDRPRTTSAGVALARQWGVLTANDADWQLLVLEFRVHAARDRVLNARFRAIHARLIAAVAAALDDGGSQRSTARDVARIAVAMADGFTLERAADPDAAAGVLYEMAAAALQKGLRG